MHDLIVLGQNRLSGVLLEAEEALELVLLALGRDVRNQVCLQFLVGIEGVTV